MGGLTREHETDNGSDEEEPCTEGEPDHRRADLGVRHGCSSDVEEANQGRGGDADQEKPNAVSYTHLTLPTIYSV